MKLLNTKHCLRFCKLFDVLNLELAHCSIFFCEHQVAEFVDSLKQLVFTIFKCLEYLISYKISGADLLRVTYIYDNLCRMNSISSETVHY